MSAYLVPESIEFDAIYLMTNVCGASGFFFATSAFVRTVLLQPDPFAMPREIYLVDFLSNERDSRHYR